MNERAAPAAVGTQTRTPWLIAHRAGNTLSGLRAAERLGIRLVEADVHLFAGRLEVRHRKTMGPVPILWDRWELAPPWAPRLTLDELLAAAGEHTELVLDLKGLDPRVAPRVATCLARHAVRRVTVCSRNWRHLDALGDREGLRRLRSVGSARQLDALRRRPARGRYDGVSIHRRLLDRRLVGELRSDGGSVVTWPVESLAAARELASWGVDGLISGAFERLAPQLATGAR